MNIKLLPEDEQKMIHAALDCVQRLREARIPLRFGTGRACCPTMADTPLYTTKDCDLTDAHAHTKDCPLEAFERAWSILPHSVEDDEYTIKKAIVAARQNRLNRPGWLKCNNLEEN